MIFLLLLLSLQLLRQAVAADRRAEMTETDGSVDGRGGSTHCVITCLSRDSSKNLRGAITDSATTVDVLLITHNNNIILTTIGSWGERDQLQLRRAI